MILTFIIIGLLIGVSTGLYYAFYGEDSFFEGGGSKRTVQFKIMNDS